MKATFFAGSAACLLLALATAACGNKSSGDSPAAASGSPSASGKPAVQPPAVSGPLPPVPFKAPTPGKLAGKDVSAEVCKLDPNGPMMRHDNFDRAIRGVAPAPDGSVYVLDHEAKLRKYTVAKGASCDFILDTKFGQAGILTILPDAKEADSFDTLAIDGKGTVYVSGFIAKAKKVVGGQVSEACSKSGRLYVDPKGSAAYLGSDKVDLDAGCKATPFKADVAKDDGSPQILSPAGADVIGVFNGKVKDKWVYKVGLFDGSGKKTFLAGEMDGDAKMCNVGTVAACGAGVCVVDANCRGLKAFDKSGKIQGSIAIGSLIGLSYPWPRAFAVGTDAAYLAATHAAVDSKADKMQYGMVFRIKGLN